MSNTVESKEFILIEAAAPGNNTKPRVIGLAYSGGKINLPGWRYPVVVDLAGLEIPGTVPLLANHENKTNARIGLISAKVVNGTLEIEGDIVASHNLATEIVSQAREGADWQLSIGAEVKAQELVNPGQRREINFQQHEGPFYHIKSSILREVSVIPVGADGSTKLRIIAQFILTGAKSMAESATETKQQDNATDEAFKKWLKENNIDVSNLTDSAIDKLKIAYQSEQKDAKSAEKTESQTDSEPKAKTPDKATASAVTYATPHEPNQTQAEIEAAAVKAERDRVTSIREMCGHRDNLANQAIAAGWDVDYTSRQLLREINSEKPQTNQLAGGYRPLPADYDQKLIEAQLCRKVRFNDEDIYAHYGERIADKVCRGNGYGLKNVFRIAAKLAGYNGDNEFDDDTLYAALNSTRVNAGFSSFSLSGILSNVANKVMMKSFQGLKPIAPILCSESTVSDFNERECFRLTEVGELEELGPDGEIKHGSLLEERTKIRAKTRSKQYGIPREWIINDNVGAFEKLFAGLGASAAKSLDQVFFQRLMSNPDGLFSVEHGNYLDGADSALTLEGLQRGRELFLLQTDAAGNPIMVMPKYLLVPVALENQASEILHSTTVLTIGTENRRRVPTDNPLSRVGLEHIVSPYLEIPRYAGNSRKSWYLFADPNHSDSFEIVYLFGKKRPSVQTAEADFDRMGMRIRVWWDFGVKEKDHRGVVKSKGE